MVWVDRFVIETKYLEKRHTIDCYKTVREFQGYYIIYDRVRKEEVISISTGYEKIDEELAEAILTMLNIKFMNKKE